MKKLMGLLMFALVLSIGTAPMLYAADVTESPTPKMVNGDLLKIDGEFYVVKDTSGKDVRLHVDKTTKLDGAAFKAGDKVEVQATDKNHAVSIKHAQPTK